MTRKKRISNNQIIRNSTVTKAEAWSVPELSRQGNRTGVNHRENALIAAIDKRRMIEKYADLLEPLLKGKMDVPGFFGAVSPKMAEKLFSLAVDGDSDKIRLEAIKDILDRAGFTKVQKVAMATASATDPKDQLVSMIEGLVSKQKDMPIEIVDDSEDKG